MIRINLVLSIISALPELHKNRKDGFYNNRVSSLENGTFCTPLKYDHLLKEKPDVLSEKLSRYLYNFNMKDCKESGGYYYMDKYVKVMDEIKKETTDLQKKYNENVRLLKVNYGIGLVELSNVLKSLIDNPDITNEELHVICINVRDVLDRMYNECQKRYILGVIMFLTIEHNLPRIPVKNTESITKHVDEIVS